MIQQAVLSVTTQGQNSNRPCPIFYLLKGFALLTDEPQAAWLRSYLFAPSEFTSKRSVGELFCTITVS